MSDANRLHALDAVRGFALLLGVVFHAGFSFIPGMIPGLWAIVDSSPSTAISVLLFSSHIFRMTLFFFVAGFFARMMFHRKGARGFWLDRSKRILVPLIGGWVILAPTLGVVWVWGLTKTFGGKLPAAPADMPPAPPGAFPLTHLWFLYYLLVLYVVVLLGRAVFVALDRNGAIRRAADSLVHGIVRTGVAAVLLPLPLIASLYVRPDWMMWFGIPTPDQSLIPQVPSLVGYGTAMTFGWLAHRQVDLLAIWGRQWPIHLAGAVTATIVCLSIAGLVPAFVPAEPGFEKLAFALGYGVAIWCWSFAVIGLATRFMSHASERVRYVADASYWIYLVHLPVVAALQVMVGHLPWHWSVKFPLILAASLIVLFLSYRYFVRSTFIGQTLNGRRYPRTTGPTRSRDNGGGRQEPPTIDAVVPHASSEAANAGTSSTSGATPKASIEEEPRMMATLEGVHKHYGKTMALAGLDLGVRRGELLPVLGPNGAGKSTAIALWLGLLEADAGRARLLDRSPLDVDIRRHVGVMMQDVALTPELRVRELVALAASYYPDPLTTEEALVLARTEALAERPYGKLSGGQKRQVQFALAVCGRPPLLFLDEPTVGLDVEARETMWRTIRAMIAQGCSIVLTTHYLEEAEALADRVAVLAAGRLIASGTVAQIRSLVSRKQISCSSTLTADEVRSWPDVVAVKRDTHRLQITVVDAEDVVRRLLAADAGVRDLEVRQGGLAEAFTELTREAA
jgi:ABC-type multidrug transport system ATPase subunit/peptidoglycan/LPS O-acetylase OafA/YrhL